MIPAETFEKLMALAEAGGTVIVEGELPADVPGLGDLERKRAALKAAESPRLVFWAYAASGVVTFLAGVPLVVRFGVRGAVYGMLLSGFSYTAALAVGFITHVYRSTPAPAGLL